MPTDGRGMTIFLSAAEASGDEHGARLVRALRARLPEAHLTGVAGPKMAEAGCEVLADPSSRATMLGGPLLHLGYYVPLVLRLQGQIRRLRPDAVVPIDSPALNWHLAAAARKVGSPVVYYIAPQVWAWAPWRARKLARLTDQVACILPFEKRYLRHRGVRATYVGHPLLEELPPAPEPLSDLPGAWSEGTWRVALLPGSRRAEIKGHAKALVACADAIRQRFSGATCTFAVHHDQAAEAVVKYTAGSDVEIAVGRTHKVLAKSHLAIAASGTVTLEVAYFGVPMVVFYRTSRGVGLLHKTIGRSPQFVGTRHLSLVNILAGRRIVPELMPWHGKVRPLRNMVMEVMQDLGYLVETRQRLRELIGTLCAPNDCPASENVADLIAKTIADKRR